MKTLTTCATPSANFPLSLYARGENHRRKSTFPNAQGKRENPRDETPEEACHTGGCGALIERWKGGQSGRRRWAGYGGMGLARRSRDRGRGQGLINDPIILPPRSLRWNLGIVWLLGTKAVRNLSTWYNRKDRKKTGRF